MITPDRYGWVYTYYGHYNIRKKVPEHGVAYMVLDDYIKRSVDHEKEKFSKDINTIIDKFKKDVKKINEKNSILVKESHMDVFELKKFMLNFLSLNYYNE